MTAYYCPFNVRGHGTKCNNGKPYRDYDLAEKEECMAWSEARCHLCFPEVAP